MRKLLVPGIWISGACLWITWFSISLASSPEPGPIAADSQTVSMNNDTGAAPAAATRTAAASSGTTVNRIDSCVNVNTADTTALQRLPGIGPVLAGRILTTRGTRGLFKKASDLLDVSGIGPAKLKKIQDHICF